jgi:hypothetical protein
MKYSYKGTEAEAASSVVILANGRAMEVRRGEKTTFAAGERRFWASWAEWVATLPDNAAVVESTAARKHPAKPAVTNPVLLRFMERVAAAHWRLAPETMYCSGTRVEVARAERQKQVNYFAMGWQNWKTAEEHARDLAERDERLAALTATGTADLPVFYPTGSSGYITQTADGELQEVRWNKAHNAIGYFRAWKSTAWGHRVLSEDFVPLTDPEMPLWHRWCSGPPVRV